MYYKGTIHVRRSIMYKYIKIISALYLINSESFLEGTCTFHTTEGSMN